MARRSPLDRLRAVALALPETLEKPFGGHTSPAFRVRDKLFVTVQEDLTAAWCKAEPGINRLLAADDPDAFFVPPYLGGKGWVGLRFDADLDWDEVAAMVRTSYCLIAPRRLAAQVPA